MKTLMLLTKGGAVWMLVSMAVLGSIDSASYLKTQFITKPCPVVECLTEEMADRWQAAQDATSAPLERSKGHKKATAK